MVMGRQIGIKSSTLMADVDFLNQSGGTQHAKRVIDGVQRHHGELRSHLDKEIFRRRMGGTAEECVINGRSLWSGFQSATPELLFDVFERYVHIVPA
jgi:hypothetical protein